jgi:hypothetical protein
MLADGGPYRFDDGLWLRRCRCARCHTRLVIQPSFLYPHRSYEPDLVEAAGIAYLHAPEATYAKVAAVYRCSARSVWRWVSWLALLVSVSALLSEVERHVGGGHSANLIPREVPQVHRKARSVKRAATLLVALQTLSALALWSRAQTAPPLDPSPLRFWLGDRFRRFREIHRLTGGP